MKNKILVAYYSRTGNTQKVGKKIAKHLNADIDDIIDEKDRKRTIIGWVVAGGEAMLKKPTKITFKKNPNKYDLVVIGTPVWAWTMTPAIRTYLKKNKFNSVAFFCTSGGQKGKTFPNMEKLSIPPKGVLEIRDREINSKDSQNKIKEFCKKIKS